MFDNKLRQPHGAELLLVATGGTIAGRAASSGDNVGYRSGEVTADELVAAVPGLMDTLGGLRLRTVQLAQIDSKDMSHALWQQLVRLLRAELARDDVAGVVITHGTDTLEETGFLLQRVLTPGKPVVITAAMRPATSLQADGPQNLLDALAVARTPGARGVLAVLAGQVHAGQGVRKVDAYRLAAFDSAPAGPIALVEEGVVLPLRPWPAALEPGVQAAAAGEAMCNAICGLALENWPRVAWITSHAGFDAALVDAAVAAGFDGLLLAGTGNGTLHSALLAAAERAVQAGVAVRLSTRCASGRVVGAAGRTLPAGFGISAESSPAQARVALLLDLLLAKATTPATPNNISA